MMKVPLVKEWGSWAVFFSSCAAGLIAGLHERPWLKDSEFAVMAVLTILGLTLLINSKNPLASAIRSRGKKEHVLWTLLFAISGIALLVPFLIKGSGSFMIFAVLIMSYAILLSMGKEHHIVTELNGFALLTIAAPAVYFSVTGQISWKLYAVVTLFFSAGVFKVRMRLRKNLFFRSVMALYCGIAAVMFSAMSISVIMLLPLAENVISAVWFREEKLRATGYIELSKGILFIVLIGIFWH